MPELKLIILSTMVPESRQRLSETTDCPADNDDIWDLSARVLATQGPDAAPGKHTDGRRQTEGNQGHP